MLPEGWKLKSLKQIGECISGLTYSPDNITDKENDGLLVLRSSNIKNGSIVLEDNVYVDCCIDDAKLTRLKDILICVRNGSKTLIGKSAIITNPAAIGQAHGAFMSVFRSESNEYVFQLFQTSMFFRQVSADLGATINSINTNNLLKYKFPFPPLPEQKKIAQILSTWDNAISATERLLENSQQRKKALMQQLLTGKKRLPGFEGEWELQKLSEICSRIQRKTDDLDHPILTISSLSGFVRQDERYSRYMAGESVNNYILMHKGEFAYNKGNSKTYEVGCIFDLKEFDTGLVPNIYVCFKLHVNFSRIFYKYLFEADYLKRQLAPLINSGVRNNGLLNIKASEFLGTKVPVPSYEEQQKIADVIHTSSNEIDALQKRLGHLKLEKKALMQQLLTGKRRVQVDAAA